MEEMTSTTSFSVSRGSSSGVIPAVASTEESVCATCTPSCRQQMMVNPLTAHHACPYVQMRSRSLPGHPSQAQMYAGGDGGDVRRGSGHDGAMAQIELEDSHASQSVFGQPARGKDGVIVTADPECIAA